MPSKNRILVVSHDESIRVFITGILRTQGYEAMSVEDGAAGMHRALRDRPDVIILDMLMPRLDGYHVLQMLRADANRKIPLIMLSHQGTAMLDQSGEGAEALTPHPFDPVALLVRVEAVLQRRNPYPEQNPFVQLSGHIHIGHELSKFPHFAVGYADLDNVTTFNMRYGSTRGDRMIGHTKQIIQDAVQQFGTPLDQTIHVRGDDFIFITAPDTVDAVCRAIIARFDRDVLQFYDAADEHDADQISISIAVVTDMNRHFTDFAEIGEVALELQRYVKTLPGSNYCLNRRCC